MQVKKEKFDPEKGLKCRALVLEEEEASELLEKGKISVIMPKNAHYKGKVLVCTKERMRCLAVLSSFRQDNGSYRWDLYQPKKVVEKPVMDTRDGLFTMYFTDESDIVEYPEHIVFDVDPHEDDQKKDGKKKPGMKLETKIMITKILSALVVALVCGLVAGANYFIGRWSLVLQSVILAVLMFVGIYSLAWRAGRFVNTKKLP